ncbi:MAG TPA: GntR family transcriptional regulator [Longimicrobiales bacterium]|nr:GntR family transcriptional regulator [Longimicrobiales bacterium]
MARKAGSIIVDRLRERILLGRYFGRWSPGDRLPSVRDVAVIEDVDRKTAAAAYRRLERESLVRVEPRSGVYLNGDDGPEEPRDPLRRLHRQWLEQTLGSAAELGLDTAMVGRMLQAVAVVESRRVPVVDEDEEHARLMAKELKTATGLDCTSCRVRDLPAESGPLRNAPFIVATPAVALRLRSLPHRLRLIHATLSPELLRDLGNRARQQPVTVLVSTQGLARELGQVLDYNLVEGADQVRVIQISGPSDLTGLDETGEVLLWPGTPDWVAERLDHATRVTCSLIAERTLREIRRHVAGTALEYVNRSSGGAARAATAVASR